MNTVTAERVPGEAMMIVKLRGSWSIHRWLPPQTDMFVGATKMAKRPFLNISKTEINEACVDCVICKDSWSIDVFPLREVEMITAMFLLAAKLVLTESQKCELPWTPNFSKPWGEAERETFPPHARAHVLHIIGTPEGLINIFHVPHTYS
jgi:hypothetical protein